MPPGAAKGDETAMEPTLLDSLATLYPLCKRLLLHTHWQSGELTGTQRLCLLTLEGQGAMTMTLLAEAMACSREQATRVVAPLVEQGYMERRYDQENRTRVWVELTEKGRELLCREYRAAMEELHNLSQEERQQLRAAVQNIGALLER